MAKSTQVQLITMVLLNQFCPDYEDKINTNSIDDYKITTSLLLPRLLLLSPGQHGKVALGVLELPLGGLEPNLCPDHLVGVDPLHGQGQGCPLVPGVGQDSAMHVEGLSTEV